MSAGGGPARFPGITTSPPPPEERQIHRPTYRVQEEDATDGTSCAPFGPCKSTRQSFSSGTKHGTIKMGTETALLRPNK